MMTVLGKLVDVLRSGQYSPEKGAFHSYLSAMIINEVHMMRRKEMVRQVDRRVSLDAPINREDDAEGREQTLADVLPQEAASPDTMDEDWRQAILASAVDHVLNRTALSQRDRAVYREYVQEGRPIEEVAAKHGLSRNSVSQIKTRINRRIVMVGQELVAGLGRV